MIEADTSVNYDQSQNMLIKDVDSQQVLDNNFLDYQLQQTPLWMGVSVIEMARKAILNSQLSVEEQCLAVKDISQYFERYQQVSASIKASEFHQGIAVADHAREYIYHLLSEYGVIQNRLEFNQLRNAGVMWRLFDRMGVKTHIDGGEQEDINIESTAWERAYAEQDRLLAE